MIAREEILQRIRDMNDLPAVSVQALKLLREPEASVGQVTQCLQYDPGLTANLIKLANSSLFPSVHAVKTLNDAIVRIGFRQTLELLMSMAMAPVLKNPLRGYDMQPDRLWMTAISGAVFGEVMMRELHLRLPDWLFTCCILRDVGKLALAGMMEINGQEIGQIAATEKISFVEAERRILGIDHSEAGAVLMENWKLSDELVAAARYHHRPREYAGPTTIGTIVRVVHLADIFSAIAGDNDGRDGLNYPVDELTATEFGLNYARADKIIYEHELKIRELQATGII